MALSRLAIAAETDAVALAGLASAREPRRAGGGPCGPGLQQADCLALGAGNGAVFRFGSVISAPRSACIAGMALVMSGGGVRS